MRKGFLFFLMVALLVAITPAAAQDEETPACTPDDFGATNEAVAEVAASFEEVKAALEADMSPEGVTAALLGFDGVASGFWNDTYAGLPDCFESNLIAYSYGMALDETVINTGILRLAMYEEAYGDPEISQAWIDYSAARAEWYNGVVESTLGVMAETGEIPEAMYAELPSCTAEDDASEGVAAMMDLINAYQEVRNSGDASTGEGLTNLISGYAGVSQIHWQEVYPQLPACYEINQFGQNVGLVYDGTLISALFARLSLYEAEVGDADTAAALNDVAAARQEMLMFFFESAFPQAGS